MHSGWEKDRRARPKKKGGVVQREGGRLKYKMDFQARIILEKMRKEDPSKRNTYRDGSVRKRREGTATITRAKKEFVIILLEGCQRKKILKTA